MNRSALIIPGMVLFFALAPSLLAQSHFHRRGNRSCAQYPVHSGI
jgi:hypothetical protein